MGLASRRVVVDVESGRPRLDVSPAGELASTPTAPPALVLLPPGAPSPPWTPAGALALRVEPRSLDDLFALARRIGTALDATSATDAWIDATRLDLARLSASSYGSARPHVAAIVSLDPPDVAGGASVETELLEIAGAESVTHGGPELRVAIDRLPEEHVAPDLWLVTTAAPTTGAQRARLAAALPEGASLRELPLGEDWLVDPVGVARRLREVVKEIPAARAAIRLESETQP